MPEGCEGHDLMLRIVNAAVRPRLDRDQVALHSLYFQPSRCSSSLEALFEALRDPPLVTLVPADSEVVAHCGEAAASFLRSQCEDVTRPLGGDVVALVLHCEAALLTHTVDGLVLDAIDCANSEMALSKGQGSNSCYSEVDVIARLEMLCAEVDVLCATHTEFVLAVSERRPKLRGLNRIVIIEMQRRRVRAAISQVVYASRALNLQTQVRTNSDDERERLYRAVEWVVLPVLVWTSFWGMNFRFISGNGTASHEDDVAPVSQVGARNPYTILGVSEPTMALGSLVLSFVVVRLAMSFSKWALGSCLRGKRQSR